MNFGYDPGVASGALFSADGKWLCNMRDIPTVETLSSELTDAVVDKVFSEVSRQAEFTMTLEKPISFEAVCAIAGVKVQEVPKDVAASVIGHVQVRRHKKKRINKKWRKRYGFTTLYGPETAIVLDGTLYVGPGTLAELRKLCATNPFEVLNLVKSQGFLTTRGLVEGECSGGRW